METYHARVLCAVTGMSLPDLQRLVDRNQLPLQPCDIATSGSGQRRGYSERRILQAAILKNLTKVGVTPGKASRAAFLFSDRGSRGRDAGKPYELGRTVLIVRKHGNSYVENIQPDQSIEDFINDDAAIIVDCGAIYHKVIDQLEKY